MLIYLQLLDDPNDKHKFERLYNKYRGLMFHVANKILHNDKDAEDAVHQAFLSIIKIFEKISDVDCPKTRSLIVIIVERKAIDTYRRNQRVGCAEYEDACGGMEIPPPDGDPLATAIARLRPRYREVILLHYWGGYSVKDLAQLLDMKPAAVQKLIERAKNALAKELEKEGIEV